MDSICDKLLNDFDSPPPKNTNTDNTNIFNTY